MNAVFSCVFSLDHCVQDVVRSWYARLPSIVQNAEQLVTNAEECAEACRDGGRHTH